MGRRRKEAAVVGCVGDGSANRDRYSLPGSNEHGGSVFLFVFEGKEQSSVIRQLGLCHRANKDAKSHVSIHVCGAVGLTHVCHTRLRKRTRRCVPLEQTSGR